MMHSCADICQVVQKKLLGMGFSFDLGDDHSTILEGLDSVIWTRGQSWKLGISIWAFRQEVLSRVGDEHAIWVDRLILSCFGLPERQHVDTEHGVCRVCNISQKNRITFCNPLIYRPVVRDIR